MSTNDLATVVQPRLMALRLIVASLVMGVLMFAIIAVGMRQAGLQGGPVAQVDLLGYIGIAIAASGCAGSMILPGVIAANWRRQNGPGLIRETAGKPDSAVRLATALMPVYQNGLIISSALIEGPAFYQLIVYFLGGAEYSLGLALGLLILLALKWPTREGVERWLATQQNLLEQEAATGL